MNKTQMLDALVEGLKERDKPTALLVLDKLCDPISTGVPNQYLLPIARRILWYHVPSKDIDGFVSSISTFVRENANDIDMGNRLGGDHEATSMVDLSDRYMATVDYKSF